MKKLIFAALTCAAFAVLLAPPAAASLKGKKLQTFVEGENINSVKLYTFSHDPYFSVRDVAAAYGSRLVYRPVTGKVSLQMNNRQLDIYIKSTKIMLDDTKKRISLPTRFSGGEVYIPASFILGEDFAEFSQTTSSLNDDAGILTIERTVNVAAPRYYSRSGGTQLTVEMIEDLPYNWEEKEIKGAKAVEISFPRGRVNPDTVSVDDGVIKDLRLINDRREARLTITLAEDGGNVTRQELKDPSRLVITVAKKTGAGSAAIDGTAVSTDTVTDVMGATAAVTVAAVRAFSGKKKIIVLDAGHGGEDTGAVGPNGTKEKEINLAIVYELKRLFDDDNEFEAVLSRTDDTFIPLVERTSFANDKQADLFVSVHCNANLSRSVTGFEIYFLNENASDPEAQATAVLENSVVQLEGKPNRKRAKLQELLWSLAINEFINESSELCSFIGGEVTHRTKIENRGVKQAGFFVLRGAQMPAVLVETAFLSNYGEEAKLKTKRFQRYAADAIYEGVKKYYDRREVVNARR